MENTNGVLEEKKIDEITTTKIDYKHKIASKSMIFEKYFPHVLEIHNDNTRNRILFIMAALLVYCFATFLIFSIDVKVKDFKNRAIKI